jgi:hypothetical protein
MKITFLFCLLFPFYVNAQALKVLRGENGKYGYTNNDGKIIIAPIYAYAHEFSEGLAAVNLYDAEDGFGSYVAWGFIDSTGKVIIPFKYMNANLFSEGLAGVMLDRRWGFINAKGEEVIPFMFDGIKSFKDGLAIVSLYRRTEPVIEDNLQ